MIFFPFSFVVVVVKNKVWLSSEIFSSLKLAGETEVISFCLVHFMSLHCFSLPFFLLPQLGADVLDKGF